MKITLSKPQKYELVYVLLVINNVLKVKEIEHFSSLDNPFKRSPPLNPEAQARRAAAMATLGRSLTSRNSTESTHVHALDRGTGL